MTEVSIIITTYNGINFIKGCLGSITSQTYKEVEMIVVDNGSKDGTADFIKENYHQVILIENKENLGAAKARNQGIGIASGRWLITLDCDIIVEDNFLSQILNIIKNSPSKVGMIQLKVLKMDRKTIYSTGIFISTLKRFYDIRKGRKDFRRFDKPKYVFGACSAAAVNIPRYS